MGGSRMAPVIRPMHPKEDDQVRDLFHVCHPDADAPAPLWHFLHPTLVIEEDGQIVASTSFTLSRDGKRGYVCYGVDVCVHPDYRRRGYGSALHEERGRLSRDAGAVDFVGTVEPDNEPMIRILSRNGHRIASALERDFYVERL